MEDCIVIEIMFVVCLSAEPTTCNTKGMQFSDMSMMACMMCAQPLLAQWVEEHPGWEITRWACQPEGSGENA
jgi:hypothetical protein